MNGAGKAADSGKHIRFASANFTIPSVNCANSPVGSSGFAYAAHWVGIDAFNDSTVEQTGVDAFCDSTGTPGPSRHTGAGTAPVAIAPGGAPPVPPPGAFWLGGFAGKPVA